MSNRTWNVRRVLGAGAAALLLTAAACGGDDDGGDAAEGTTTTAAIETTTTSTTEALTFEQAEARYTACLEEHGSGMDQMPIDVPLDDLAAMDPEDGAVIEMGIEPAFIAAHAECWPDFSAAIEGGAEPPSADTTTTTVDAAKAAMMHDAVDCLNARGWDFLEPGVEVGPLTMAPRRADFDWDDEAFLDDQWECQQEAGMIDPGTARPPSNP